MGGNVTQQRYRALPDISWRNTYNGVNFQSGTLKSAAGSVYRSRSQTTTSYRSSGTEMPYDDPTVAKSLGEFTRKLVTDDRNTRGGYDTGHEFSTVDNAWKMSHRSVHFHGATNPVSGAADYRGAMYPLTSDSSEVAYPTISALSNTLRDYYGAKFIRETTPVNSVAGLAVALAEFYREGLPQLVGATALRDHLRKRPSKDAGEEYLNWEFGYIPLASDLATGLYAVLNSHSIISQYLRDSGRTVRRRRVLSTDRVVNSFSTKAVSLTLAGLAGGSNGSDRYFVGASSNRTGTYTVATETTYSFSSAYTYHVPGMDHLTDKIERYASLAGKVTGLELSPEVVWNLAPWSWLSDWMFNLGTIIGNLSNFATDSLVMRYGYLMCERKVSRLITHPGCSLVGGGTTGPVWLEVSTTRKERLKATPYGFGLNPSGFTGRQWAILGALGLTKAPTLLR